MAGSTPWGPTSRSSTVSSQFEFLFLPWPVIQNRIVFSIGDRNRLRDWVLDMASSDPSVVAGAVLGSLAHDEGDRWSDLDLMFAVADDVPVTEVLEAWSGLSYSDIQCQRCLELGPRVRIPRR